MKLDLLDNKSFDDFNYDYIKLYGYLNTYNNYANNTYDQKLYLSKHPIFDVNYFYKFKELVNN